MSHSYNPDTQPFELALSNIPFTAPEEIRGSLVDVSDTIDMAKRILLQHKVRNFSATDVILVAQMICARRSEIRSQNATAEE